MTRTTAAAVAFSRIPHEGVRPPSTRPRSANPSPRLLLDLLKLPHPTPAANRGRSKREEPMASDVSIADLSIARRDVIKAAGVGLAGGLLAGGPAGAQTPAAAQTGAEFWTAQYTAKKGDVSLQ